MSTSSKSPVSGGPEINRRRSQRVILSVPITLVSTSRTYKGKDGKVAPAFDEATTTLVVNAHGALITLEAKVDKGEVLRVTNHRTQAEHLCKVIFVGPEAGGKTQIGVEFTTPAPDFWGVVFPSQDWAAPLAAAPQKTPVKR